MPKEQPRREVIRFLRAQGWFVLRTSGRHEVWPSDRGGRFPLPRHSVISPGVIADLERKIGSIPESWK